MARESSQQVVCGFCSPYDTLEEVVGIRGSKGVGSLEDWGIAYRENQLREDGSIAIDSLQTLLKAPGTGSQHLQVKLLINLTVGYLGAVECVSMHT